MKENLFINYNGKIFPANEPIFTAQNRSFRYGDGLFESIRIINGKLPLFPFHFPRLVNGLQNLKIILPDNFTADYCQQQILELAQKAGLEINARIRLSIFRKNGGLYLPESNEAEFLIEISEINHPGFSLNKTGLKVDIFTDFEKHASPIAAYKSNNAQIYVMAAIFKREQNLDDCLVINSRSRVIESIDSNLFLVKDNQIFTPPLAESCVAGVMRQFILNLAEKENIALYENPITLEELFEADEAFLSNAIYGIKWIKSYKSKSYENNFSKKLSELINAELNPK